MQAHEPVVPYAFQLTRVCICLSMGCGAGARAGTRADGGRGGAGTRRLQRPERVSGSTTGNERDIEFLLVNNR